LGLENCLINQQIQQIFYNTSQLMNYPGASCEVVWLKQRKLLTVPRLTFILSSLIANISRYRFFVAFLANGIYEESF
jgi:hypothetical protein